MLDLNTLRLVSMVSFAGFAFGVVLLSRLVPEERGLQDWARGAVLLAAAMLLLGLRGLIPDFFSIAIANSLVMLGIGFGELGSRKLYSKAAQGHWHWLAAGSVFLICVISQELQVRVMVTSLLYVPFFASCAWQFWRGRGEPHLRLSERLAALIFIGGTVLFIFRAVNAPRMQEQAAYLKAQSWVDTLPYVYAILLSMWLSLTLTFIVSVRLQRQRESANQQLRVLNARLATLSMTDDLTGISNRRHFLEVLAAEWGRAERAGQPLTIAMIDIDWFKNYNDHYGHQAGDECLRRVSAVFQKNAGRGGDLVARYGGEEFVIIAPATDDQHARALAEKICAELRTLAIPHAASDYGVVTASIGVATAVPQKGLVSEDLLKVADQALYQAKAQGRNRCCFISQ